jgi:pimeloyl-ACP methyl ester carboxylesterase
MRLKALLIGGVLALAATSLASAQALKDVKPSAPLTLAGQGSFYVGGHKIHTDARTGAKPGSGARYSDPPFQEGDWTVDQMYVQFQTPMNAKRHLPVVMTHGCCLSAKTWETTPDGRMGWAEYFVRKGRATYLTDQVGRARSGFDATPYNRARQGKIAAETIPTVNMATEQMAWWIFRIGPKPGEAFADQRFPMAYIDQMWKQVIPDLSAAVATPTPTLARLAELSNDLGGAVLIGHSQSGFFPQGAALSDPKGVRAMISLEPGGCSASTLKDSEWAILAKIPSIIVFGDHLGDIPLTNWTDAAKDCTAYVEKIKSMGGDATFVSLPALGIKGNGHMFMQDNNSLEIADLMLKWIGEHVEKRR